MTEKWQTDSDARTTQVEQKSHAIIDLLCNLLDRPITTLEVD